MHIIMVASECAPVAKAGGLGDVVHGLSRELSLRRHQVQVVLPKYDCLRHDRIFELHKAYANLWVPYYDQVVHCDVYRGSADGLDCFLIDAHSPQGFFERGRLYGDDDDAERFAFFSRAAMEFLYKANIQPDIIHCHDWQTGLVPVLLYEIYEPLGMRHPRVCYTLHNVGHQGITGEQVIHQVGLDYYRVMMGPRLLEPSRGSAVNLMKGGIVYANFVTTVSPHYAGEILTTDLGRGLQNTLQTHREKFGGILNGVDYDVWNPELDRHIAAHYTPESLPEKAKNKAALRQRLMLQDARRPLVAVISRLDPQKGVDLIMHAVHYSLANGCQFVLLGASPDPAIGEELGRFKAQLNDNPDCHLELGYDEDLSHQVYAGADMVVMPSVYEPCGLTQMIAMKYATVPIVRRTGGLADTVFDANYSERGFHERNGYVFNDYTADGLESAMRRAIGLWYKHPEYFRQLRINGMRYDYSWNQPGQHYLNVYHHIMA